MFGVRPALRVCSAESIPKLSLQSLRPGRHHGLGFPGLIESKSVCHSSRQLLLTAREDQAGVRHGFCGGFRRVCSLDVAARPAYSSGMARRDITPCKKRVANGNFGAASRCQVLDTFGVKVLNTKREAGGGGVICSTIRPAAPLLRTFTQTTRNTHNPR